MTRLITKQMRDSFKVRFTTRIRYMHEVKNKFACSKSVAAYFESTKKQRILILKGTIK